MLRAPSRRKRRTPLQKLNLIPILDSVFIFIFFLLMSANFIKIYEIASDVPIIAGESEAPKKEKPLALTLRIDHDQFVLMTGIPSRIAKKIPKTENEEYDLETLHVYLANVIKKKYPKERSIILEPRVNLTYEEIVMVMDAVRNLRRTDDAFYTTVGEGSESFEERHFHLFDKIVFGNIQDIEN